MLTEIFATAHGVSGWRTQGAFSRFLGVVRLPDAAGTAAQLAASAGAVCLASVPAFRARKRVHAVVSLGEQLFRPTARGAATVRTQNNYMALVITNGGDVSGPHRRRATESAGLG